MKNREILIKACLFRAQHRGSREADMIIGGFAAKGLEHLKDDQLAFFAQILTWDDNDIFAWMNIEQKDGQEDLRRALNLFQSNLQASS